MSSMSKYYLSFFFLFFFLCLFLSNEQILEDTGKEVKREHVCYNSQDMETAEVSKDKEDAACIYTMEYYSAMKR